MIYIAIAIWLVLYVIDLSTDLKAKKVNHFRGALLRVPAFVAIYFLTSLNFTLVALTAYFLCFDVGFALGKNKHPFWLGTTSFLDKLQAPLPYWLRAVIKIGLVVFSIYLYITRH